MAFDLRSVSEVFNKVLFRIPDYQRGYSWDKYQLEDFWNDIIDMQPDHPHYTGVITIEKVKDDIYSSWDDEKWMKNELGYTSYFVIDGQQRLTTVMILIKSIIDSDDDIGFYKKNDITSQYLYQSRGEGLSEICIFGYEKDNPSFDFWKYNILHLPSNDNYMVETAYTRNLKYAKDFFIEKINQNNIQTKDVLKRLLTSMMFNLYVIDSTFDVFEAFEAMNNRGKQLSLLELLKNRLIFLSTRINLDDIQRERAIRLRSEINNTWKNIYAYLGKDPELKLDDDEFLRIHWIMYFGHQKSEADQLQKFLLGDKFSPNSVKNGKLKINDIERYIRSLSTCIKYWYELRSAKPEDNPDNYKNERLCLSRISKLGCRNFEPLIVAAMYKDRKKLYQLIINIERFIFVAFYLFERKSHYKEAESYRYAKDIYSGEMQVDHAIMLIRSWIQKRPDRNDKENFIKMVKDRFEQSDGGFYKWDGIKYLLYSYEEYLCDKSGSDPKISWDEYRKSRDETIEHILPRNTINNPYWTDVLKGYSSDDKIILTNSLGNLLLLSRGKNSRLSNSDFTTKKNGTENNGYNTGSYSELEVSREENWDATKILKRTLVILKFIEERWDVNLSDLEDSKSIMYLEFVNNE